MESRKRHLSFDESDPNNPQRKKICNPKFPDNFGNCTQIVIEEFQYTHLKWLSLKIADSEGDDWWKKNPITLFNICVRYPTEVVEKSIILPISIPQHIIDKMDEATRYLIAKHNLV